MYKSHQTLVSVYIPTYNRLELLKRAIGSVQCQTHQNFEVLIVDDGSVDGTREYLKEIAKEDTRIRYFLKEKNSGACISRNIAIEHALGEFITGLDDDDYFCKNRLKTFLEEWKVNDIGLFSNIVIKRNKDKFVSNYRYAMKDQVEQKDLLKANHIGNQIFTKTNYLKDLGGFDPNMKVWQDLELWYRLTSLGKVRRIKKDLYVMDVSHPHERISHNKGEKVKLSYSYFVEKHKLDTKYREDLATHMTNYSDINLPISIYLRKFLNFMSLGTLKLLIMKTLGK